MHDITRVTLIM